MFVVDLSFKWPEMTAAELRKRGVTHVIAYAGSRDPKKNVSKERLWDWLDNELGVALVHENTETDDRGLYTGGQVDGQAILTAAEFLGYDYEHCVLYKAVDRDVTGPDLAGVSDFLRGFHQQVPVPGTYGDIQTLTLARNMGYSRQWWQSDSKSYSQGLVAAFAQLVQIYNDPNAAGLPVDYNQYQPAAGPLMFMGGTMQVDSFTTAALGQIKALLDNSVHSAEAWQAADSHGTYARVVQLTQALQVLTVDNITAALKANLPTGAAASADAIAQAVTDHLGQLLSVATDAHLAHVATLAVAS